MSQFAFLQREWSAVFDLDNFVVRPRRRLIEKYKLPEAWTLLSQDALAELSHEVAGLSSELDPENEEAKRFDLLVLSLQLALLRHEPGFARLRDRVKELAGLLEEKSAIPMVREQMALIQDVQSDEWWQDVTVPMLEVLRRRHLTEHGVVEPGRLYESPFTDLTPQGPDGLFSAVQLDSLLRSLDAVRATAAAA